MHVVATNELTTIPCFPDLAPVAVLFVADLVLQVQFAPFRELKNSAVRYVNLCTRGGGENVLLK